MSTYSAVKNSSEINSREYQRVNKEWIIQAETQAIKNRQSRDTGNKEWTNQRHRQ